MAGINQKRVQRFLISCGNEHLQYLCVPARLGPMMWELDTSKDGIISLDEWDSAIAIALDKKLEQRAAARSRDKKVAACVEIKILRRVRAESSRRPPRHRRDACSMTWRCPFLTARPSQDGGVIAEK